MASPINIFWFRRDLRLDDNDGLYHALQDGLPVLPVFVFDKNILDDLEDKTDRRVEFIHESLWAIQQQLLAFGSSLYIHYGTPEDMFGKLSDEFAVQKVFTNEDYEPYARQRDEKIEQLLKKQGKTFHRFKDQVIFEKDEVVKDDGKPYTIFTPYSRKWKALVTDAAIKSYDEKEFAGHFYQTSPLPFLTLEDLSFKATGGTYPSSSWNNELIKKYREQRDIPAIAGTSRLSVHLRFGTISIRALVREAGSLNETFLNELIWREFYQMILWHFPEVISHSFKPAYDQIPWRNNEKELGAWYQGQTGYPIVDAGMRELNKTGFMHNRVRMIVASFLTRHLLCDWRLGEAYFAKKLLDYDLAANNGGWQWAAGSGCDAAPYFRIFNPYLQTQKFDPDLKYIRKWIPELEELNYPQPIVNHEMARKRCLETYALALKK